MDPGKVPLYAGTEVVAGPAWAVVDVAAAKGFTRKLVLVVAVVQSSQIEFESL